MPHIIKSGIGKGTAAGVSDDNQLFTDAKTTRDLTFVSAKKKLAFIYTTSQFSITTSEYKILWIKAEDSIYEAYIEKMWINWNGGDTNHNRVAFVRVYRGSSTPSANNSVITPSNLVIGNSESADMTINEWDEVGSGMTVSTLGTNIILIHATQGNVPFELSGSLIIPVNNTICVTAQGEEAGKLSLNLIYWMAKKETA
jgi:hypothetical protein